MRNPENVLISLTKHSNQKEYKYERLYRLLYNEEMYLIAYQNIYSNNGSMTKGTDSQTVDGMSLERIHKIILTLKDESYQPKPVRRTYIPKKNGKMRPLGIPSFEDKLLQEVIRMILEQSMRATLKTILMVLDQTEVVIRLLIKFKKHLQVLSGLLRGTLKVSSTISIIIRLLIL